MSRKSIIFLIWPCLWALQACRNEASVPLRYTQLDCDAAVYPDYRDIVIPANIAPLNFLVDDPSATEFVVEFHGKGIPLTIGANRNGKMRIDSVAWRKMLQENRGDVIQVSIYANQKDGWKKYNEYGISVAEEEIDNYLSYRLIEPGYEMYRQLGLYQRNLTNWDVNIIYENDREYCEKDVHCINCHNFRNNSTQDMLFHVRGAHNGTIFVRDGVPTKVQIKDSTIITSGVYPSWHPTEDLVAFSTNLTGQAFHIYHNEKVEVVDEASDLLLYDVAKNEVNHIVRSRMQLETFPCWSPDGTTLYYCSCDLKGRMEETAPDSLITSYILSHFDSIYYDLMKVKLDMENRTFSEPQMVVDASAMHKSITVPRVSPDGRYVLYTLGDYGQFHVWHKSSDLWVKDLEKDSCYALSEANSEEADSYHSWSSNGRWIVFSSRRDDGNYTRPYIAYFDKNGTAHKAFLLPQEDPGANVLLLKSYNVPELTKDKVKVNADSLRDCVYKTNGINTKYIQK